MSRRFSGAAFFFFKDTATTEISTLPLPDALPILLFGTRLAAQYEIARHAHGFTDPELADLARMSVQSSAAPDRKSTRLNSSHSQISYAGFCLQKTSAPGSQWPQEGRRSGSTTQSL